MRIEQVKVTPKLAAKWLEKNFEKNRNKREAHVKRLAADMKAGRWIETGETIKFNTIGLLVDGQHRLSAIILSGCTLNIWVAYDVPSDAIKAIDTGASRTASDVMAINSSLSHPKHLPTLIRRIMAWEAGSKSQEIRKRRDGLSNQAILEYAIDNPHLSEHIRFSFEAYSKSVQASTLTQGEWAFLHWLFSKKDPEAAADFLLQLAELTCPKESPIRSLFQRLNSQVSLPSAMRVHFAITAWNAWRSGKKEVVLKAKNTEEPAPALV